MTSISKARRTRIREPGVVAWLRLARVYQKLERAAMEHLRSWDLSVSQFDILAHVGAGEGITQQELSDARLTTKGNLSQMLERMEADGLICREREGRAKRVFLTDAGRALFAEVVPVHEAFMASQFRGFGPQEDVARLAGELRRLDHSLSPH